MQVLPFKIPKPIHKNLIIQEDTGNRFYSQLHQHEEIQISIILKGEGTLLVGDGITHYKKNDVFVIGSNLPHVFRSENTTKESSHMISVFFKHNSFGDSFFDLEELKASASFFKTSVLGFKVLNPSVLKAKILTLQTATGLQLFISFLELLQQLNSSKKELLSSFSFEKKYTDNEGKRMRLVFEYTMNNYTQNITLDTIAKEAAMTKNAFCKYFKKRTNKTYVTFLNEIRIAHACKLLAQQKEFSIAEVSEKSGFNNISNFNRAFKNIKKHTPRDWRLMRNA